jgi:hypothetical protein
VHRTHQHAVAQRGEAEVERCEQVRVVGSLGLAQAASAQEFDDRWYVSGSTGVNFQDKDRGTEDSMFVTMGFGKFLNPNLSLEAELNYQNPDKTVNSEPVVEPVRRLRGCALPLPQCGLEVVAVRARRYRLAASRGRIRRLPEPEFPGPA